MIGKFCLVVCCLSAVVLANEKYTDKYDNIDIKEIVENRKLLLAYVNCILDKGRCTAEGKVLKENVQDALETGCKKCTQTQQDKGTFLFDHVIKNEPGIWDDLTGKFDPKGLYRTKYEDEARARGIVIPHY